MLPLVVIAGPTAAGKSEIAVELALHFQGEVVSADSVQLYRYFNIGTAKLTPEQQKGVPHHLLDVLEPDQEFSVAQYQSMARSKIEEINQRGKLPFLVGGTGLYIQAVIDSYRFPSTPGALELRRKFRKLWNKGCGEKLYQQLKEVDPETAGRVHPHDFRRISRALEVYHLTGTPISKFQQRNFETSLYQLAMVGLTRPRPELHRRIEERVEKMFARGIVEETKAILDRGYSLQLKPFQSLGYKQVAGYLKGEYDLATAIELTKRATRNYAKRQLTWFRRDPRITWFLPGEAVNLLEKIGSYICRNIPIGVE